jgi:acyl-CoA synthetase (AMP-forming)/AMP-acid ligase II
MRAATLNQLLQTQVADRGAKTALKCANDSVTYAQLNARAVQVANGLAASGVKQGERVAYLGKNTLAYFEYFLGAMKIGAVTVPINWRLAEPEVKYVVDNARVQFLLVESEFDALAAKVAPDVTRLVIGNAPDEYASWRERQSAREVEREENWREPLLQLYTSGTTGRPKGAILTHQSLFGLRASAKCEPPWFRWSPDDLSLIAMPVAHISGTGWGIWTLQHGATGVITREFQPNAVFEQIVSNRITKIMMVPTAMKIAAQHARARDTDFSFLRYIYYGGAPLPVDLFRECAEVFQCGFVQMYGLTETSGTVVALAPEDHDPVNGARFRSVGKPLDGVELKILDTSGCELSMGMTGEIVTRSQANMSGYFEMPMATAEAIDPDGWLRTGDAGYLDADGYLYLQDRIKDMIISGGENIYPTEVENAICDHPDVAEVAVIGVPDEKWGEAVKAVIVPKAGVLPHAADILTWAAERIAKYKLPRTIEIVRSLPRNHTGKVLRRELRDAYRLKSS